MANKVDIEVQLQISKAMSSIRKLNTNLSRMVSKFNQNNSAVSNMSNKLNSTNSVMNKINNTASKLAGHFTNAGNSTNRLKNDLKTSDIYAKSMAESATQISKALAGLVLGTQFIQAAETYGSAVNKLNNINAQTLGPAGIATVNGVSQYSQATQNMTSQTLGKIYNSAQSARTDYGQMINNIGKQAMLAGDAFDNNLDNVIKFNELLSKAYTISGARTEEQIASMTQLTQALGSGVLQGDELRSVREGATLAYQAIEEFAQKVYNTDESLKELGAEGKVTSDLVVAAILQNADAIDSAMELSEVTVGQFWTLFKNSAFYAFSDTFKNFDILLAKLSDSVIYETVINEIHFIADAVNLVINAGIKLLDVIKKNEEVAKPIIQTIVILLTVSVIGSLIRVQVATIATFMKFIGLARLTSKELWIIIGVLGVVFTTINLLTSGALSSQAQISSALTGTFSVILLIKAALFATRNAYIALGLAAIGVLGLILTKSIITKNSLVEGVADLVARVVASIVYIKGQLEYFASVVLTTFMNVAGIIATEFTNIVTMAKNMVSNLVTVLQSIKNLENPFTADYKKITEGVESIDTVIKRNESTILKTPSYNEDAMNAYNSVYDKVTKFGNSLFDSIKHSTSTESVTGLDYTSPDISEMLDNIGDTADNTDQISNDLQLVTQDLSFLKDLAELEWKKEFTTASINVSMTNNNNISDKNDIGDIATILKNRLQTELKTVASGTYS